MGCALLEPHEAVLVGNFTPANLVPVDGTMHSTDTTLVLHDGVQHVVDGQLAIQLQLVQGVLE